MTYNVLIKGKKADTGFNIAEPKTKEISKDACLIVFMV